MLYATLTHFAAALCGTTVLLAAPQQAAPIAPAPTAPVAPPLPPGRPPMAPPAPPAVMPVLPKLFETQLVAAPSPTISLTFGQRVGAADGQFLVTGPVRTPTAGSGGQLANFLLKDGVWAANRSMADVGPLAARDFAFQRIAAAGKVVATCIESIDTHPSTVAVLEPQGSGWAQTAVLAVPTPHVRPGFGSVLATDGKSIAVSAVDLRFTKKLDMPITNPEVFLFARHEQGWQADGKVMLPPDPHKARTAYWFGASLAMDTDVLVVGCPSLIPYRAHEPTPSSGESFVFIFRKGAGGWVNEAEIKGASVTAFTGFGTAVAIEGDLLAVRSTDVNTVASTDAAPSQVWVYRRVNGVWKSLGDLKPARGLDASRAFGAKIVISNGRIIVSETLTIAADNGPERSLGMVLVFEEVDAAWVNTMRLQPKEPCMPGQFGQDIAAIWPWVAVGRVKNEREGIAPGGAYLYKIGH